MELFKEVMPHLKSVEFMDCKEGCLSIDVPHVMDGWYLQCFHALSFIRVRLTIHLWQLPGSVGLDMFSHLPAM